MDIILHGCCGRMGTVLTRIIAETDGMNTSAGVDPAGYCNEGFPVYPALDTPGVQGDIVIDFSHYTAVKGLLRVCAGKRLPLVIATTGMEEEELDAMHHASRHIPIFHSANMSLGINLLVKVLRDIAPLLEEEYHMEILEKHHAMKKDSPSGTALLLADAINGSLREEKELIYGRHGKDDDCRISQMGIHALRGGTIPGEHTVIFAGPDEIIEMKHASLSRDIFARGALKAARYIVNREPGLYSMEDIIRNPG